MNYWHGCAFQKHVLLIESWQENDDDDDDDVDLYIDQSEMLMPLEVNHVDIKVLQNKFYIF